MKTLTDLDSYLKIIRNQIEDRLSVLVPEPEVACHRLFDAARYSLLGSGKRLRPILTLAVAEMFGASIEKGIDIACAIEMIHTYSLIHDDLPCMDDDDYRRGKPTLHKACGEGHAVLAGDFLLTYAFEVISTAPLLSAEQKIAIISRLAKNSGGEGMIAGQILDIEAEGKQINLDQLNQIHQYKTGALITASIEIGGMIAGATPEQLLNLRQFGQSVGLAFQIIDDLLDVTSSEEKHGKALSSDQINHKVTYVTLLGIEPARQKAEALLTQAHQLLDQLPCDSDRLHDLADCLVHRRI